MSRKFVYKQIRDTTYLSFALLVRRNTAHALMYHDACAAFLLTLLISRTLLHHSAAASRPYDILADHLVDIHPDNL